MQEEPICCRLEADAFKDRAAWIAVLTRRALRSAGRDGLTSRLIYAAEAEADVRKLVEQERLCCAFLTFDLIRNPDDITVTIAVPESASEAVDDLFALFLPRAPERIA
jgi:hypothetical protein